MRNTHFSIYGVFTSLNQMYQSGVRSFGPKSHETHLPKIEISGKAFTGQVVTSQLHGLMEAQHRGSVRASHQLPWVLFSALPRIYFGLRLRFIEQYCLASGECQSNKPIQNKAGISKSSWSVHQASTTKNYTVAGWTVIEHQLAGSFRGGTSLGSGSMAPA